MDNNSSSWQSIGIGFIFIGLIGWFSIALFEQIIHAPWQFLSIFDENIRSADRIREQRAENIRIDRGILFGVQVA
jgi:hypothetical protein